MVNSESFDEVLEWQDYEYLTNSYNHDEKMIRLAQDYESFL